MQVPAAAALSFVVALAAAPLSGQEARPIQPYGLYPAGTVLTSPLTGITFLLPEGFRAEWDPDLGGLLTLSNGGAFGAVWGWSEGTVEEVAAEIGARLEAQGFTLQPRAELEVTPQALRGIFDSSSDGVRGVLHAAIQKGPQGGVVAVVGLGQTRVEGLARSFVDSVTSSLEWSVPGAVPWREELTGAVLTWGEGTSTGTLSFCGPTEYRYQDSIAATSAATSSSEQHGGRWGLIGDLAGAPTLFLEATDGRAFGWGVLRSGDGFVIDGRAYRLTGQC